jgi:hypothetical protein
MKEIKMKEQRIKITGSDLIAILLILVLGLVGCGGNDQAISVEPTDEVIPTEEPTKEVIPTDAPTEEPTEEVIPTEEMVDLPPILGDYSVMGTNPDGSNYENNLEITASNGIFWWNWLDRNKPGVGLSYENMVTVAWAKSGYCGPFVYTLHEDGILKGIWTERFETNIGNETLMPRGESGEGIVGSYALEGTTPDGNPYSNCKVEITNNGDMYEFYWACGDIEMYGVGIQSGNIVTGIQASKRKACTFYSYSIEDDGTLDAVWVLDGTDTSEIGTEVATPDTSE